MSFAQPADLAVINELRRRGCFEKFKIEKFHHAQATGICSDGLRVHISGWVNDTFGERLRICNHDEKDPSSFRYGAHGFAMLFGLDNILEPEDAAWKFYVPQFEQAQRFAHKNLKQLNLLHHWPCGKAREAGLNFHDSLVLVLNSKARLKRFGPFDEVSALFLVDTAPGEFSVHRIKLEKCVEYYQDLADQNLSEQRYYNSLRSHKQRLDEMAREQIHVVA